MSGCAIPTAGANLAWPGIGRVFSRCDILTVDPLHGSDPPPAMAGGINVANRQRSSQEVITVANPRRSNPD